MLAAGTWSKGYQNDVVPLPNIRKLQAEGLEFHRHYSNVPVCCPSRASFWSGRHAHHIPHLHNGVDVGGAWNNYEGLPLNYTNRIDQVLEREGYAVQVAGKTDWDTGGHSVNVRLGAWTMYTDFPYNIPKAGGWHEETNDCAAEGSAGPGDTPWSPTGGGATAHGGDWNTANKTVQWIREQAAAPGNSPWFAFQGMDIVHPPYRTTSHWYEKIDPTKIELPPWAALDTLHPCDLQSSMLKGCTPSDNESAAFYNESRRLNVRRVYYSMIAEFDAMVGFYMDTVQASGQWNETVFIVTSDHGDMQMEHQQHYKMVPYDASASVPMVVYDGRPGKQVANGGYIIDITTQLIDIFPTIMEFAQVPPPHWPAGLDGHSLVSLFTPPLTSPSSPSPSAVTTSADRPDFVVSQFHGDNIAMSWFLVVATGVSDPAGTTPATFKLIVYGTGKEVPSMLFNLDADRSELKNLINDAAHASVLQTMDAKLRTVIDYPTVATAVAQYGLDMFKEWINATGPAWKSQVHEEGLRWDASWNYNASGSIAAVEKWLTQPAVVKACKHDLVFTPSN